MSKVDPSDADFFMEVELKFCYPAKREWYDGLPESEWGGVDRLAFINDQFDGLEGLALEGYRRRGFSLKVTPLTRPGV